MSRITIVGGGIAGLVAATECAEAGAPVRLLEARSRLGGRGATSPGEFHTGLGPHAFYAGPLWDWLVARDLHKPFRIPRSYHSSILGLLMPPERRFLCIQCSCMSSPKSEPLPASRAARLRYPSSLT